MIWFDVASVALFVAVMPKQLPTSSSCHLLVFLHILRLIMYYMLCGPTILDPTATVGSVLVLHKPLYGV